MVEINWNPERKAWRLSTEAVLPATREDVFEFFSDAFQLERITPPMLNFKVLTEAPINIQAGTLIDYKLRLRGFPVHWRTEISTWDPPYSFTDRQLRGPYYLWEHLHTFEEVDGGTLMKDEVHYRVPGGALVHWLMVKNDLLRIFQYRLDTMIEIFAGEEHSRSVERQAETIESA